MLGGVDLCWKESDGSKTDLLAEDDATQRQCAALTGDWAAVWIV